MAGVRDHEELDVWKLANELKTSVRPILSRPSLRSDADLFHQLVRATRSPCRNIAEGFSRFNPRDFAHFLRIAKASLSEFIDHMKEAHACGYTTPTETADLIVLAKRARGAAMRLIEYLESAKPPPNRRSERRRRPSPAPEE